MRLRLVAALYAATAVVGLVVAGNANLAGSATKGSLPAVGTKAEDVDPRTVPGAVPYEDGHAIPLKAATPDWYTPDLHAQVLAAGAAGTPAPTDAPWPSEVGIRPGAWMISPAGCTMNFVFQSSSKLAIGTAGHCVDKTGQSVVLLTLAPGGNSPVLVNIGTVIARQDRGVGADFALVSINPALYPWVSGTAAAMGGPCGSYSGSGPETVTHYGHGLAIGTGGTPREGVALTWNTDSFGWDSAAIYGDSGSPVRVTDLKAAGDLTHLVVDSRWLPSIVAGTRISKMLSIAKGYNLLDSPLCASVTG